MTWYCGRLWCGEQAVQAEAVQSGDGTGTRLGTTDGGTVQDDGGATWRQSHSDRQIHVSIFSIMETKVMI